MFERLGTEIRQTQLTNRCYLTPPLPTFLFPPNRGIEPSPNTWVANCGQT